MSSEAKNIIKLCDEAKKRGIKVEHIRAESLFKENHSDETLYVVYCNKVVNLFFAGRTLTEFEDANVDLFFAKKDPNCQVCLSEIGENYAPACYECYKSLCTNCSVKVSDIKVVNNELVSVYNCPFCRTLCVFYTFCTLKKELTLVEEFDIKHKFEAFKKGELLNPAFFKFYLKRYDSKMDFRGLYF